MRLTIVLVLLGLLPGLSGAFECPQKAPPGAPEEKAEDCPWAGAARLMGAADRAESAAVVLSSYAPGILRQLDADRASRAELKLWGRSINFDELANGEIVNPAVLGFIAARAGVPPPKGRIMHAGVEHTYGYLFSLLPTKFGFKRARWVRPDIEDGLGLPRGLLGPEPAEGTLLANITCLAGGIVLKDDHAAMALLKSAAAGCGAPAKAYISRKTARTRLAETVTLPGGRKVVLRTDFVPFAKEAGGNTHLLIYSVYDSALKQAYLVTAFPVNAAFVQSVLDPGGLGPRKPVQTRYNAFVEGLTGAGELAGSRRVLQLEK